MWRLYLEEGEFGLALDYCETEAQRQTVLSSQADHYFDEGNYEVTPCCRLSALLPSSSRPPLIFAACRQYLREDNAAFRRGDDTQPGFLRSRAFSTDCCRSRSSLWRWAPPAGPRSGRISGVWVLFSCPHASLDTAPSPAAVLEHRVRADNLTQQTMLCTWLTELYLEALCNLQPPARSRTPPLVGLCFRLIQPFSKE